MYAKTVETEAKEKARQEAIARAAEEVRLQAVADAVKEKQADYHDSNLSTIWTVSVTSSASDVLTFPSKCLT